MCWAAAKGFVGNRVLMKSLHPHYFSIFWVKNETLVWGRRFQSEGWHRCGNSNSSFGQLAFGRLVWGCSFAAKGIPFFRQKMKVGMFSGYISEARTNFLGITPGNNMRKSFLSSTCSDLRVFAYFYQRVYPVFGGVVWGTFGRLLPPFLDRGLPF